MLKHRFKLFLLLFCFFVMESQAEMDIKQFADHDQYADVKISPTGKYLALAQYAKGKLELLIITRDKRELVNKIAFSGNDEVGDFYWVNDERLVMKIFAKSYFREFPAYYGELFSIDAEKPQGKLIFGSRILQGTPKKSRDRKIQSMHKAMASSWANIVDLLPGDTKHILISARPYSKKKNKLSRLYKLNVYDASIQFVTEAPLPDTKILTNKKGELVFAVGTDKEDNKAVFDYDKKK